MKKRQENKAATRNKKQQKNVTISLPPELIEEDIKKEPMEQQIIMERILLPESIVGNFFNENVDVIGSAATSEIPMGEYHIADAALKTEIKEETSSNVKIEDLVQVKKEPENSQYEIKGDMHQMIDGSSMSEEICRPDLSTLSKETLEEPDETKIEIEETYWPEDATHSVLPDLSQVFLPQHQEKDAPLPITSLTSSSNAAHQVTLTQETCKRVKKQPLKVTKKLCSKKVDNKTASGQSSISSSVMCSENTQFDTKSEQISTYNIDVILSPENLSSIKNHASKVHVAPKRGQKKLQLDDLAEVCSKTINSNEVTDPSIVIIYPYPLQTSEETSKQVKVCNKTSIQKEKSYSVEKMQVDRSNSNFVSIQTSIQKKKSCGVEKIQFDSSNSNFVSIQTSIQKEKSYGVEKMQVDSSNSNFVSIQTSKQKEKSYGVEKMQVDNRSSNFISIQTSIQKEKSYGVEKIQVDSSNSNFVSIQTQTSSPEQKIRKKNTCENCSDKSKPEETVATVSNDGISETAEKSDYFVCHLCSITFKCIDKFNTHVTENHKNYLYCEKCKFLIKTNNKIMMKSHASTCCDLTTKLLADVIGLAQNISLTKDIDADCREACSDDENFPNLGHYMCHLCDEHFSNLESINSHISEKHKKYMYCKKCRFLIKIANRNELKKHDQKCCKLLKNTTCIYCKVCAKLFFSVSKMLKHVNEKHSSEEIKDQFNYSSWVTIAVFKCSYCNVLHKNSNDINSHVIEQHLQQLTAKNSKPPYAAKTYIKCIYCKECYADLKIVISHISLRHPDKSNITLNSFNFNTCTNNNFKLETGSQTKFQNLEIIEFLYKSNQIKQPSDESNNDSREKSDLENIMEDIFGEKSSKKITKNTNTSSVDDPTQNKNNDKNSMSKNSNVKKDNSANSNSIYIPKHLNTEIVKFEKYILVKQIENKLLHICTVNKTIKPDVKYCIYCSTCNLECSDAQYISNHVNSYLKSQSSHCPCPFCDKYFDSHTSFLKHLNVHTVIKLKLIHCKICKTGFYNQSNYDNHVVKHRQYPNKSKLLVLHGNTSPIGSQREQHSSDDCLVNRLETMMQNAVPVNNSTEKSATQKIKMCDLLKTCRTYCEKFMQHKSDPSVYCTVCLLDISVERYFDSLHLLNCLSKTKNIPCIFCSKTINNNMLDHMIHLVQHFESKSLIPLICQSCNLNFLSTYNEVIHRRYQKCKAERRLKELQDDMVVMEEHEIEIYNTIKTIQLEFYKIKTTLKENEILIVYCITCKKDINGNEYLTNHIQTCVNDESKYACSFCDKHEPTNNIIMSLKNIMTHITVVYTKIVCTKCDAVFLNSFNQDCHHLTQHTDSCQPNDKPSQPNTSTSTSNTTGKNIHNTKIIKLKTAGQIQYKVLPKNVNILKKQFSGVSPQCPSLNSNKKVKYLIIPASNSLQNTKSGTQIILSNTNMGNDICNRRQANLSQSDDK